MSMNGKISDDFYNYNGPTYSCSPYQYKRYQYESSNNHIIINVTNTDATEDF